MMQMKKLHPTYSEDLSVMPRLGFPYKVPVRKNSCFSFIHYTQNTSLLVTKSVGGFPHIK